MRAAECVGAVVLLLTASSGAASAQAAAADAVVGPAAPAGARQVTMTFDRKLMPVPHYRLAVYEDGTTTYEGEESTSATMYGAAADQTKRPFQQRVRISPPTAEKIFSAADRLKHFDVPCASKAKNIADMGNKTLQYQGPDGSGSCSFNFTEDKDVQAVAQIFQGIAETLDIGRKLDQLHRFDRLGLDLMMTRLVEDMSNGYALEVGTIAPSLRSIAADPGVMSRVRARATTLLNQSASGSPAP